MGRPSKEGRNVPTDGEGECGVRVGCVVGGGGRRGVKKKLVV